MRSKTELAEKARYWDRVAKERKTALPQTLWRTHSDAVHAALFSAWLPPRRVPRVLKTDLFDEGMGAGLYDMLTSRAQSFVGTDISVHVARAARSNHGGLSAAGADVRDLPFADGAFDVIVSNSTLDHFDSKDEIVASLRELRRVLRTGGELLLTLDNLLNPIIALRNVLPFRLLNRLGLLPYQVGATFGPHRLQRVLRQSGFEVREVAAVLHCPRVLAVALARLLEGRAGSTTRARFLAALLAFEVLARWPGRFLTGHFVAVRAVKR
jgi:SAM-dependent methyltransferase